MSHNCTGESGIARKVNPSIFLKCGGCGHQLTLRDASMNPSMFHVTLEVGPCSVCRDVAYHVGRDTRDNLSNLPMVIEETRGKHE